MNLVSAFCVMASLIAATCANPTQNAGIVALEDTSSLDGVTWEKLEKVPIEKGAKLMQEWYHISRIDQELKSSFVPSPGNIPVYIVRDHGKKETAKLNNFVEIAKEDTSFGNGEVTVFITGLPSTLESVQKANDKLVHAYIERYNHKPQKHESYKAYNEAADSHTTSTDEETSFETLSSGNLIIIDLGQTLDSLEHLAIFDVDEVGAMIGKSLVMLANDCDMPQGIIHVVAQGVAAHVAGAAGDEYTRLTDNKFRRITALDPFKILTKDSQILSGLARGDAEFVDAIHTSVYGIGTLTRVGDIDFFPNGLCIGAPGSENIIEASMRATRYFAESVYPGNERNFPAVEANSLKEYKKNNGFGKRAFMGIATDYDLTGDYMLQVNEKSPFGMRAMTHKHNGYHSESWH